MRRDGDHLWAIVTATVRPLPPPKWGGSRRSEAKSGVGESASLPPSPSIPDTPTPLRLKPESTLPIKGREVQKISRPPDPIEPNRFHRLTRERASTVDLHNLNQDRARAALTGFILRAHAEGERTVLVITGKGALGDGILRRRTPDWLAEPPLRAVVAGLSEAHVKHGGAGALYVALKRR